MSVARKCDRCGAYFDPTKNVDKINSVLLRYIRLNNDVWKPIKEGDLCPKCAEEISLWYDNPKDATISIVRHTPLGTTNKPTNIIDKKLEDDIPSILGVEKVSEDPISHEVTVQYNDRSQITYDRYGRPIIERRSSNA